MDQCKFEMFEQGDLEEALKTAAAGAMVLHPVFAWGAFLAAGAGTLAGVGRAMAERAELDGSPIVAGTVRAKYAKSAPVVPHAPVEALSRPILSEMIRDAALSEKPRRTKQPDRKKAKPKGPARPVGLETPRRAKADDLKRISGIGPKLEMTLNDLGIYHFDQIAAWGADEIRWIDDYLRFPGRVKRDRWIEQATALV